MLAKSTGRPRTPIICGRKNCTGCKRFRHVTDFAVDRWADLEKTRPHTFRSQCRICSERQRRARYQRTPYEERAANWRRYREKRNHPERVERRREEHENPQLAERRAVNRLVREMVRPDRYLYQMEGILPIGDWSVADEDYDPTPVPQGCPSCYLRGGHPCDTCPDANVKAHVREARKKGLIIGNPLVMQPLELSS